MFRFFEIPKGKEGLLTFTCEEFPEKRMGILFTISEKDGEKMAEGPSIGAGVRQGIKDGWFDVLPSSVQHMLMRMVELQQDMRRSRIEKQKRRCKQCPFMQSKSGVEGPTR